MEEQIYQYEISLTETEYKKLCEIAADKKMDVDTLPQRVISVWIRKKYQAMLDFNDESWFQFGGDDTK